MTRTKLPRYKVHHLNSALLVCRSLDVPSGFRYASNRTISFIADEIKDTKDAYPEPDFNTLKILMDEVLKAGTKEPEREIAQQLLDEKTKVLKEAHAKWASEIEPHMKEEIEVEIYQTDLVEINDTINVPPERRAQQNQALIDALMPIFRE